MGNNKVLMLKNKVHILEKYDRRKRKMESKESLGKGKNISKMEISLLILAPPPNFMNIPSMIIFPYFLKEVRKI